MKSPFIKLQFQCATDLTIVEKMIAPERVSLEHTLDKHKEENGVLMPDEETFAIRFANDAENGGTSEYFISPATYAEISLQLEQVGR